MMGKAKSKQQMNNNLLLVCLTAIVALCIYTGSNLWLASISRDEADIRLRTMMLIRAYKTNLIFE